MEKICSVCFRENTNVLDACEQCLTEVGNELAMICEESHYKIGKIKLSHINITDDVSKKSRK